MQAGAVIRSYRSRALKCYWEGNDASKLPPADVNRITTILQLLEDAATPQDLDLFGLHFHALTGNMKGRYAVTVRANWRITFAWDDSDAINIDFEDYH